MRISCCMTATNVARRLYLIEKAIKSIDDCDNIFYEKIMSVDVFGGGDGADLNWFDKYKSDWKVFFRNKDVRRSMINNQRNSIIKADSDTIFFTQDDVFLNKVPKIDTLDKLFNGNIINNKPVGFVCYNNHVWINFNENPKHIIDYINDINNYVIINNDVFLIKKELIKDRYYLNFPTSIFKKDTLFELHDYAFKHCVGLSIETGITKAWFDLYKNDKYEVLIYLKNEIIDDIKNGKKITVLDFYNYANFNFWNNDLDLRHPSIDRTTNSIMF